MNNTQNKAAIHSFHHDHPITITIIIIIIITFIINNTIHMHAP